MNIKSPTNIKRVVSGIQPSGILHLGNYLGAIKNWIKLQESNENNCFFFIADSHSSTTKFLNDNFSEEKQFDNYKDENQLNKLVLQTAACLLASGLDPKKCKIFVQSQIPAHFELMWILSCIAPLSWINNMTQFKEKANKAIKGFSSTGLYTYPVLMAADVLLYKGELVPVGEDQKQHLELTKNLAIRLNKICSKEVVPIPQYILNNQSSRIMSLQNGTIKMSKSDKAKNSCISLIDSEEEIKNKIIKAKTDSIGKINFDKENRPEMSNLMNIYSSLENMSISEVEQKFEGANTLEFKQKLVDSVIKTVTPISNKAHALFDKDRDYLRDVLKEGKVTAQEVSLTNVKLIKQYLNYLI